MLNNFNDRSLTKEIAGKKNRMFKLNNYLEYRAKTGIEGVSYIKVKNKCNDRSITHQKRIAGKFKTKSVNSKIT